MPNYEYRVVAAPNRGVKAKGIKSNEARFAHALEEMMNGMAQEGWEYQRAETLPSVERSGLRATSTTWRNVLVFRRAMATSSEPLQVDAEKSAAATVVPVSLDAPMPDLPQEKAAAQEATEDRADTPAVTTPQTPDDDASGSAGASRMLRDNGVEELSEVSGVSTSLKQLAESRSSSKSDS